MNKRVNKKKLAEDIFGEFLDDETKEELAQKKAEDKPKESQVVVYYNGDMPDTIYEYVFIPEDGGAPYAKRLGYWNDNEDAKTNIRQFQNLDGVRGIIKIPEYDEFLENKNFIPNKEQVKVFDSMEEFLLELI